MIGPTGDVVMWQWPRVVEGDIASDGAWHGFMMRNLYESDTNGAGEPEEMSE